MKLKQLLITLVLAAGFNSFAFGSMELLQAVKADDTKAALALIRQGADVNFQSSDGTTALIWAAYNDNEVLVKRLLRTEANANIQNQYGSNPMIEAGENANTAILKALLKAGADVESPNLEGQTALMTVVRTGSLDAAKLLIKKGADVNRQEKWQLQTPLMWAAAQLQPEMLELLLKEGANPDTISKVRVWKRRVTAEPRPQRRPPGGWTALSYAARQGCAQCVEALVAGGADLNLVSPEGITPLLMATLNGRFNTAAALIAAGADVNRWDNWGRSPLYSAVDFKTIPTGGRADRPSTDATTALDVINLLLEKGANPDVQLKLFPPYRDLGADRGADRILGVGTTPLIRAAKAGDIESVTALIRYGALVDLSNSQRMTPLMVASGDGSGVVDVRARYMHEGNNVEVAKLLLEAGADINSKRENGGTALHGAAGKGWNAFISLLAEAGADLNATNNSGSSALDVAMGRVNSGGFSRREPEVFPETGALLVQLGAAE